ncbi:response regulator [Planktothrix sp. FACHB-1355]|uniref:Response regulator n=1 Tax=Aerosakkonema funiforme FACHB-1375 TaxID=2949571 RepID=A0A926VGL9_9CYAN|nr:MULTISPECIES: response regulator [Oscillatoriales]MBD2183496.1 response regulator [Aerosakkonema funiforme FACHB-1375]MBD3558217.1 response regulator [Planktothrix sp. FACHB-1355]
MSKRVLVVDDEPDIRAVIQGCLEDIAGWEVLTANSGEQGLQIAGTQELDGILMDVSMPGMGGLEALQKLQENASTETIPVALLTAKALTEEREQFASLTIVGLIVKPFDPMTLVEQVASVFGWES